METRHLMCTGCHRAPQRRYVVQEETNGHYVHVAKSLRNEGPCGGVVVWVYFRYGQRVRTEEVTSLDPS